MEKEHMSRPLPRYRDDTDPRKLDRIIDDTITLEVVTTTHTKATLPGDTRRLRGIPVIGGITGTSPGTDPHQAAVARENSKRFRHRRLHRA